MKTSLLVMFVIGYVIVLIDYVHNRPTIYRSANKRIEIVIGQLITSEINCFPAKIADHEA